MVAACSLRVRLWCKQPSDKRFPPRIWAALLCTRPLAARWISGNPTMRFVSPAFVRLSISGGTGGFAVGIVANQKLPAQQTDHEGHKRVEFGGVIYTESAEKASRFIMDCNQNLIPLVFFHDVNGFMVGRDAEWSGIIKAGAKMVNAVSNSVVPKITVIIGGSFGAGLYAMCGKAYDPRFVFAWPTARYAVMSGAAAAGTLVEIKIKQLERGGKKLSDQERQELFNSVKATYDHQTDPRYGAARLWIDK